MEAATGLDGVHAQMTASAARSPCPASGAASTAQREERHMSRVTYEIVQHDGGWAYRVGDVFSDPFPTHGAARRAAEQAAREQLAPGQTTDIEYEDEKGRWHEERSSGRDRPDTEVKG